VDIPVPEKKNNSENFGMEMFICFRKMSNFPMYIFYSFTFSFNIYLSVKSFFLMKIFLISF